MTHSWEMQPVDDDTILPAAGERPRRRGPGVVGLVAVVLAVALLAGMLVVAGRGGGDDRATTPAPSTTEAPGTTTTVAPDEVQRRLEAILPELQAFVEQERGLRFLRPVNAAVLADQAFRDRLRAVQERDRPSDEELAETTDVLAALGLLERGVDLRAAIDRLLAEAVAGFYDPKTDELVVRGDQLDVNVRSTLVHELVHALQDQHFDIERDELDDLDDEQAQAFTGLVEGDASAVQQRWLSQQPADEVAEAAGDEAARRGSLEGVPPILIDLLTFPYLSGPPFVAALRERSLERLNQAFTRPPTTSEHLLHPERYLAGERPVRVAPPRADGEVFDQGAVGEFGLLLLLGDVVGAAAAVTAADGWGGDWYVAWRDGDRACVRFTLVMDGAEDAREAEQALRRWAAAAQGRTLTGTHRLTATGCG